MTPKLLKFHAQGYFLTGILTVIPIWITWLVFRFFLGQLSKVGKPWVGMLSRALRPYAPAVADGLLKPWFQSALAVTITIAVLYLLGWATTRVVGKRLLAAFDAVMARIPFVQVIYGATKRLVVALRQEPAHIRRIVLINFPSSEMRAVGFITRTLVDKNTGQQLAVVYVPSAPNPASGYLEIVPLDQVIPTDLSLDAAISYVMSGGTIAPEEVPFSRKD